MMMNRILLVDDELTILSGLSKALYRFCDFQGEVRTVTSGRDAIREISHRPYDICFLDIKLPDLSGTEVIKKIKEISPNTMVAVMTACVLDGEIKRTIEEHASLFITKPLDLSQIRAFVNYALEGGKKELAGEKRQSERKPFKKTISYSVSAFDIGELMILKLKADTIDISKGGMGIWTDYPLEVGHILKFDSNDIERTTGVVKWSRMFDNNHRVGVKFV